MLNLLSLVTLALATYRLARFIAIDEGPFAICFNLRHRLGAYDLAENGEPATVLGRGMSCPHCVGIYAMVVVWVLSSWGWGWVIVEMLAITGLQSWLWSMTRESYG